MTWNCPVIVYTWNRVTHEGFSMIKGCYMWTQPSHWTISSRACPIGWTGWCPASCTWTPPWSWLRCTRVCSVVSRPMSASQKIAVSASKESEWEVIGHVLLDTMLPLWWRNQCHAKFLARVLGWWRNHCRVKFWQEFWYFNHHHYPALLGGTRQETLRRRKK